MQFRKLSGNEIDILKNQNCFSNNWDGINVTQDFNPATIYNSKFSGTIYLEIFKNEINSISGIPKNCGIFNSVIHNCYIGANSLIDNVKLLANYKIGKNVIIENVNTLSVSKKTTFGNGVELEILNEGGGRELKIFDKLSSQLAYLTVTRRDKSQFIKKVEKMIDAYADSVSSDTGLIGDDSRITNCNYINNVKFGSNSIVDGALHLEEGTIDSNKEAPVKIGEGVTAKSFVILSGSKVDGLALLDKTFVGQGVKIGKQYSAENSAFFANCEGFHGEACSVFAGPYSVTHHKSTLLIAGMFSFYNAGSGSNQSNHLYKLGPVHQGVLERGAKTGSFSYMMFPCHVGAFTGVIGKHYANFDISDFPFSYILESNGKSVLMPAMNLCTVGTKRDSKKWQKRDRRNDSKKNDRINFELFSPYIIGKIIKGLSILESIHKEASDKALIKFGNVFIKNSRIEDAIQKYKMVIDIFIGDELIKQIKKDDKPTNIKDFLESISNQTTKPQLEKWIDVSGMFAQANLIENLIESVQNSQIQTIAEIEKNLDVIYNDSNKNSFLWCVQLIEMIYKKKIEKFSLSEIAEIIEKWKTAKLAFNNLILEDAEKEFRDQIKISFGIDGDQQTVDKDFEAVRGTLGTNTFVQDIQLENTEIEKSASELMEQMENN